VGMLGFNHRKEPWNNLNVRKAIAYAIDKKEIFELAYLGLGKMATGLYLTLSQSMIPRQLQKEDTPRT